MSKIVLNWFLASVLTCAIIGALGCAGSTASREAAVERPIPGVVATVAEPQSVLATLKGRPTAIFFWSSWCRVCVSELPSIAQLASAVEPHGVTVISVAMFDAEADALAAARRAQFTVPIVLDPLKRLGASLGVNALPAMILLDAHGARSLTMDPESGAITSQVQGPREWRSERVMKFLIEVGETSKDVSARSK